MRATEILKNEHKIIKQGLADLLTYADQIGDDIPVPLERVAELIEFFQKFADHNHHAKEEQVLFPALAAAGLPTEHGPIGVMLGEHERGRAFTRTLKELLPDLAHSETARGRFVSTARDYGRLLGQHIDKENEILFRMADTMLDEETDRRMVDSFALVGGSAAPFETLLARWQISPS